MPVKEQKMSIGGDFSMSNLNDEREDGFEERNREDEELIDREMLIDALRNDLTYYRHELEDLDLYDAGYEELLSCAGRIAKNSKMLSRRLPDKSTVLAVDFSFFCECVNTPGHKYAEATYEIPTAEGLLFTRMLNRLARRGVPIAIVESQEKGLPFIEKFPCERLVNTDRINDIYPIRKSGARTKGNCTESEMDLEVEYEREISGGYPPIRPTCRNWPMFVSWRGNAEYRWRKPMYGGIFRDAWENGEGDMNLGMGPDADDRLFDSGENLRDLVDTKYLWKTHELCDWYELRINLNTIRAVVLSVSPDTASPTEMEWFRKPLFSLIRFGRVSFEGGYSRKKLEAWFETNFYPKEEGEWTEKNLIVKEE